MALYHFNVTPAGRSKGTSAVASAAYIAGERLYDEYYGKTHNYTKKEGVLFNEILLPPNAPERFKDRATLWNELEKVEKTRNAQLFYNFNFALQNELTYEENKELAQRFIRENRSLGGSASGRYAPGVPAQSPYGHTPAPFLLPEGRREGYGKAPGGPITGP